MLLNGNLAKIGNGENHQKDKEVFLALLITQGTGLSIRRRQKMMMPGQNNARDRLMLSDYYKSVCEKAAQQWKVSPEIHPEDYLFQFVYKNPAFQSKEQAIEYYFNDGASSAQKLRKILDEVCGFDDKPFHLFEFASGYGCVTRHIRNFVPFCTLTACDIHEEATQFIEHKLETKAVLSAVSPEDFQSSESFDVVFALSFFSHMPKNIFPRWLGKLASQVKPGGFLIFTTHGLMSQKMFFQAHEFDHDGFYYFPASEQKDLSTDSYGYAMVKPKYVFGRILENSNARLKFFHEGYWWQHQDLYVLQMDP